jgi:hypothetical protein
MDELETLDHFIGRMGSRWMTPNNAYVTEPGFSELYVRSGFHMIEGQVQHTLDIGRIRAEHPGAGAFSSLMEKLAPLNIGIYVECVHNKRFAAKLLRMGFVRADHSEGAPSFYKRVADGHS